MNIDVIKFSEDFNTDRQIAQLIAEMAGGNPQEAFNIWSSLTPSIVFNLTRELVQDNTVEEIHAMSYGAFTFLEVIQAAEHDYEIEKDYAASHPDS